MLRILRRWWVRWIVLPVVALFAIHAGWTFVLMWRFESRLDELRAAGEPVVMRDLASPPVAEADNAAPVLAEAHAWYLSNVKGDPCWLPEEEWDEEHRQVVMDWLASGDPYVEMLKRAAAKPAFRLDLDWEAGPRMEVPMLSWMLAADYFLDKRVRLAERATAETLAESAAHLDLARKAPCWCVIELGARWGMEEHAAEALETLARRPGFDARAAHLLLDARLAATMDSSLPREALLGERALMLSLSRRWIGGESPYRVVLDEDNGMIDAFLGSWLARPFAYRDALRLLEAADRGLRLVDQTPREAFPGAIALADELSTGGRFLDVVSDQFATAPVALIRDRLRHQATIRVVRVGLALLVLRQENGAWPQNLDAVVPLVGAETILDPYSGERLQYEPGVRVEANVRLLLPSEDRVLWRLPN